MLVPFRDLLARLRVRRGLSQTMLGVEAGYDHSYISRLEGGKREPSRQAVLRLIGVLEPSRSEQFALMASAGYLPDEYRGASGVIIDVEG